MQYHITWRETSNNKVFSGIRQRAGRVGRKHRQGDGKGENFIGETEKVMTVMVIAFFVTVITAVNETDLMLAIRPPSTQGIRQSCGNLTRLLPTSPIHTALWNRTKYLKLILFRNHTSVTVSREL